MTAPTIDRATFDALKETAGAEFVARAGRHVPRGGAAMLRRAAQRARGAATPTRSGAPRIRSSPTATRSAR